MTFEEAKKLLKKEFMVIGFHKSTEPFEFDDSHWFGYEKPSVLEAFRVLAKEGYYVTISGHDYDMRKKRLQKEYEKNTKAPGPGEEQPEEKKGIIYPSTFPKADFYYKHVLNEGNPALKEAASQFNDALLDEQAKKIVSLEEKCKKYAYIVDSLEGKLRELKAENRRIKDSDLNLEGLTYATRELKEKNKKIDELTKENEELREKVAEKTKLVEMVRKGSKEYCEYGIAAEKMIQKMAKDIVNDRPVSPKDYEQYRLWAKGYRFNPQLPELTDEEEKKLNTAKSTLDDLKKKAYEFFNAKACNLGLVGSKDGNGIIDQMIGVDIAEEGGDLSGVFVLFGKDFIDALKKVKDVWQE